MRDLAPTLQRWNRDGCRSVIARVVSWHGFGGRRAGEAYARNERGEEIGSLLGGGSSVERAAERLLDSGARAEIVEVVLGDAEAVTAGLACGGTASVLVQAAATFPAEMWDRLASRRPVAISTVLDGATAGATALLSGGDLLAGGKSTARVLEGEPRVLEEAFVPPPLLLVIGHADLAGALGRQAALLGWESEVADGPDAAAAAAALNPSDALVVLSHDPDVDTPALSSALSAAPGGAGGALYVGALGSRHTQAARRERLAALGFGDDDLARIHGPVGLDLGARSPEEVAVAICAEILAFRSGRSAASLRSGSGPING